jgi:hypothetical protein
MQTRVTVGLSFALTVLLAFALVSCGGKNAKMSAHRRQSVGARLGHGASTPGGPLARVPPAQPVAMTNTPPALFTVCHRNSLLSRICPRRVPTSRGRAYPLGSCYTPKGTDLLMNGHYERVATAHCVPAAGGFEAISPPRYLSGGRHLAGAWDGTG